MDRITLKQAYQMCLKDEWAGKGGERSATKNSVIAMQFFGEKTPLNEITTDWIYAWVDELKKLGNSNGTINRKLAALSKIMAHAHHRGKLESKPNFPKRHQEPECRERYLTREEEEKALAILAQWEKDDHAEAFCVLIDTGMRPSELWRLEGKHCNFDNGTIFIPKTKTHKPRYVPMLERVKQIISRRLEFIPKGQRVFPFDNDWFGHVWDRMKYAMDLGSDKEFVPYALRHTCASRLAARKAHMTTIKEWMGHKNITITQRYTHPTSESLQEAAKALENF